MDIYNTSLYKGSIFESELYKQFEKREKMIKALMPPKTLIDYIPDYLKNAYGINIGESTKSVIRAEFEEKKQPITKERIESIIYEIAKSNTETKAGVVCMLHCFGIVSEIKMRLGKNDFKNVSIYIAKNTGFNANTVRRYLSKFDQLTTKYIEISLKGNLNKAQKLADEHKANHLLIVDTKTKKFK